MKVSAKAVILQGKQLDNGMKLSVIDTGFFKLDGGAMFGVVPKTLWSRQQPADENNLCTWAARCLLVEDGDKLILIDTGLGNKQDEKFFGHYQPHGAATLDTSIREAGYDLNDVTDVLLTHLHFDHVGGATRRKGDGSIETSFPNATYWSNTAHWEWATHPNPREKASFLKENLEPLQSSGQLRFIENNASPFEHIDIITVDGHTEKMMLPVIHYQDRKIIYLADLVPSSHHLPLPWVMSYDVRPLLTMEEKERVLDEAADDAFILFFEHDPIHQAAVAEHTEKGVRIRERGNLELFIQAR